MKKIVLILCFFLSFASVKAQETYTIKGETLQLKTEVEGTLDLLWNIINNEYRYFVRTADNTIVELTNTRGEDNTYQKEYINTLKTLTNSSDDILKKVNLTLFSLKGFIDDYNIAQDSGYVTTVSKAHPQLLLGVFGGVTNSPFVTNPNNTSTTHFGAELELLDRNRIKGHALFVQLRHVLEKDDFNYSTTELSLGYRFRFINSEAFSLYANTKFATLNFVNTTVPNASDGTDDVSETVFDVPFIFGIGTDIRVTKCSYITLAYNELFAVLLDNNGNFSTNITVGYKLNL